METSNVDGKYVVVVGLGRFGGQIAAARWLAGQGARVRVTDVAPHEKLTSSLAQLSDLPIEYRLGGHDEQDLEGCDLLVVSPAVPKHSPFLQAAHARGISFSAEMNLFLERCPARRIIGVTGSAGKSTTTAMIGSMLQAARIAGAARQVWMGGNIGHSLLNDLDRMTAEDLVVLELSSFQLEDLGRLKWSPPVAVITNLQPNHLDRHGTLDAYADAKMNLVRYQQAGDVVIIHPGDDVVRRHASGAGAGPRLRECRFEPHFEGFLQVPGEHNRLNAAQAVAAARAIGVSDDNIAQGLASFHGLPHRLEFVAEVAGVRYYNDSKSTVPESTRIAVESFDAPLIALVGGRLKPVSYTGMSQLLAARCRAILCFGEGGPQIYKEVMAGPQGGSEHVVEQVPTLAQAVRRARDLGRPGDIVLLSPACTSYDEFNNYEERGEAFRRLVAEF